MLTPVSAKKASALIFALVAILLTSVIATLVLNLADSSHRTNASMQHYEDTCACAKNANYYLAAVVKEFVDQPSAKSPSERIGSLALPPLDAAVLGVDTDRYTVVSTSARILPFASVDCNVPVNRNFTYDPLCGNVINSIVAIPIEVEVRLRARASGAVKAVRATSFLKRRESSLLRFNYLYNGVTPSIFAGLLIKGGFCANTSSASNPARLSTWTGNRSTGLCRIQADYVGAEYLTFTPISGRDASTYGTPKCNGVYLYGGDRSTDGITYMTKENGMISAGSLSTGLYSIVNAVKYLDSKNRDFIPAFLTRSEVDGGQLAQDLINPASDQMIRDAAGNLVPDTGFSYVIDSTNPKIKSLAPRFGGNYQDGKTGFQPASVSALPDSLRETGARALIEPPRPASAVASDTDRAVESAKLAARAGLYVLIETPPAAGMRPLPPVAFKSAAAALAYKERVKTVAYRERLAYRLAATDIVTLPDSAIETKRSFYDASQVNKSKPSGVSAAGADLEPTQRVSAVDIDLGALKGAVTDLPSWNGTVYVDITDPRSKGWVSYDKAGNALTYDDADRLAYADPAVSAATGAAIDPLEVNNAATSAADQKEQNLVAVRLHNADTIPNGGGRTPGLTLATNTSVYVVGNVNADGSRDTDVNLLKPGATSADNNFAATDATKAEDTPPMMIACDSLTAFGAYYKTQAGSAGAPGTLDSGDYKLRTVAAKGNATSLSEQQRLIRETPAHIILPPDGPLFQELNFSMISGAAEQGTGAGQLRDWNLVANPINLSASERRGKLDLRVRGSLNLLFKSLYNKKLFETGRKSYTAGNPDYFITGFENTIDTALDARLRKGLTPPAAPRSGSYSVEGLRVAALAP